MSYKFFEGPGYAYHKDPKFKAPIAAHESIIPALSYDDYKDALKPAWDLDRTDDGVLTAKWWTLGKEMEYGVGAHRGWGQLFKLVEQDPDTEVLIVGGWGDTYLRTPMAKMTDEAAQGAWWTYEHEYVDGTDFMEALVNLRIPTIGVINAFAPHSDVALLCDITLMADDAVICDPHFGVDAFAGDGIQIVLQQLMGIKRANYAMMTMEQIDGQKALDYGLVSEVLPKDKIWDRASELAAGFLTHDRLMRRLQSEVCKDPWREPMAKHLRSDFGREVWAFFFENDTSHEVAANKMPD